MSKIEGQNGQKADNLENNEPQNKQIEPNIVEPRERLPENEIKDMVDSIPNFDKFMEENPYQTHNQSSPSPTNENNNINNTYNLRRETAKPLKIENNQNIENLREDIKIADQLTRTSVLSYSSKDFTEETEVKKFNSPEEKKAEVKQLQEKLVALNKFAQNSAESKTQIAAKLYGNEFNEEPKPEDINKIITALDLKRSSILKNLEAIDPKGPPSQSKYDTELQALNEEEKKINEEIQRLNLREERNKIDQGIFDRNKKYQGHTQEDYNTELKTIDEELKKIEDLEKSINSIENYKKLNKGLAELEKQEQKLVQESINVNSIILKKHELNQLNQGLAELEKQDHQISKELQEINSTILKNTHPKQNELSKNEEKLENNLAGQNQNAAQQPSSENVEVIKPQKSKGMWRRFVDSFTNNASEPPAANNENNEVNLNKQAGKGSRNLIKKISESKLGENLQNLRNKFRRNGAEKINSAATPDHAPETPHAEHHNNKITH